MSSDYYGRIAGETADRGAAAEEAWLVWIDEHTRQECTQTPWEELRAAFMAGAEFGVGEA